ncbi:UNKNOWN [Stylonychia lemnae]|uniref:Uncharacterized protein n=1 Tax=Stylonychia lemnae TaxID=5949 RepID=A0A077ZXC7_STYLE|nr:UNKNOWN [Stylonychia lemnae]|eukprot:CDW73201.1 UNKNOWN [Stylonychia lemnae]
MNNLKFDLAFQVQLDGSYAPQDLSKYLEIKFSEIDFEWAHDGKSYSQNYREIPLIKCPNGRFNNETVQTDNIKLTESYLCPQTIDFKFRGSFVSKKSTYILLGFKKCLQKNMDAQKKNITCASEAEINSVFDRLSVNVALMNQFVDVDDKSSNPIKTLIKSLYMTSNSMFSISDALSTTGGFIGIISIILNYFLCWFQDIMFYQQIIHDMFYVEKKNDMPRVLNEKNQCNLKLHPSIGIRQNQDSKSKPQFKSKENGNRYQTLLNTIKQRVKFRFTLGELFRALCLCVKTTSSKKIEQRKRLFKIARKKIDNLFEIERIFKTMKTAKLLNKIILSKYQRKLTPFFRSSLVRSKIDLSDIKNVDQKQHLCNKKEELSDWSMKLF